MRRGKVYGGGLGAVPARARRGEGHGRAGPLPAGRVRRQIEAGLPVPGDEHRSTHPRTGNARDERCQPGLEPVRSGHRGALAVGLANARRCRAVERQNRPVHAQVQHFEPKRCMQATLPVRAPAVAHPHTRCAMCGSIARVTCLRANLNSLQAL